MAKVLVVFGGTKGIGKAIAQEFLKDGYKTAILSRNVENIEAAQTQLNESLQKKDDSSILGLPCDVNDERRINDVFKIIEKQMGSVDVVVNAAGINVDSLLVKASLPTIQQVIATNLVGSILTSKAAVKSLLPKRNGCIVNVGSIVGTNGNVGQSVYGASKSGLVGFTKSLAKEVGGKGIRVNLVVPGLITTDMTANLKSHEKFQQLSVLKRQGTPQDVAAATKMLVDCTYINGMILYVDGGLHLNF